MIFSPQNGKVRQTLTFKTTFRLVSMQEVHRRHQSDADRAVDDLIASQTEIDSLERALPDLGERHRFYQDLRGYVTDLVECFDEKVGLIIVKHCIVIFITGVMLIIFIDWFPH